MPFTPITLEIEDSDGSTFKQEWKLAINYNVLADAQEKCGYNFLGHLFEWIDDPSRVRALFWAALLPYQPELRDCFDVVGEYLDATNRIASIDGLMKAYVRYLPKNQRDDISKACDEILDFMRTGKAPKGKEKPEAPPLAQNDASLSTGQNSAPSLVTTSESSTTTNSAA